MGNDIEVYLSVEPGDRPQVAARLLAVAAEHGLSARCVRSTTEGFAVPRAVFGLAGFAPAPLEPDALVAETDVPVPAKTAPPPARRAAGKA